jgi:hypothetical protein
LNKEFLNQFINFVWTVVCFAPVLAYWIEVYSGPLPYFFVAVSLIFGFLPAAFFQSMQLSQSSGFYEKAGVRWVRKFVQNGDVVKRITRKDEKEQRVIKDRKAIEKYLKTIAMYERYHFVCLVFFLLTTFHAAFYKEFIYSVVIFAGNVFYNILPILLQQYNRVRILKLLR